MKHLGEDELVELYYGEAATEANTHLRACRECSASYAEFKQSLDAIRPAAVPQRGAEYRERVWEALRPQLIPYQKKPAAWRRWAHWRVTALAASCAVLLAAAFLGGRYWERIATKNPNISANPQATQRVVLVVLTDHLDRTERLLVQLEHADSPNRAENEQLQSEARELLASNRLYRVTASNAGDPALAGALDRLDGVLAEIANDPNLTGADLERVRNEMNTKGILFEIRVLRSRSPDQGSGPESANGATI
jgi:anti-sigma-K factor RskA